MDGAAKRAVSADRSMGDAAEGSNRERKECDVSTTVHVGNVKGKGTASVPRRRKGFPPFRGADRRGVEKLINSRNSRNGNREVLIVHGGRTYRTGEWGVVL